MTEAKGEYVPPSEYTGTMSDDSIGTQASETSSFQPSVMTTVQPTSTGNLFGQQNQAGYAPIQYGTTEFKADPLQETMTKVAMLNNNFRTCGLLCYKYVLLLLGLWSALHLISRVIHFHADDGFPISVRLVAVVLTAYEIFQFAFLFLATHRKNLSMAINGTLMLKIYMVVVCVFDLVCIFLVRYGAIEFPMLPDDFEFTPNQLTGILIAGFLVGLILEEVILGLLLLGAIKVRDTLEKTKELIKEGNYIQQV